MPAMSKLIPIHPCLCADYCKGDSGNLVVEAKVDGIRCIVSVEKNEVTAWTRNGRSINLHVDTIIDIIDLRDHNKHLGDSFVLDCELLANRVWLIDLPLVGGTYRERRTALEALFWNIKEDRYNCVRIVPVLHDPELDAGYPEDIDHLVELAVRERFEGIVLKHPDAPYQQAARAWFKVKPEKTIDLTVTGTKPNGSLIVSLDGQQVIVGIGLSDAIRSKAKSGAMLGSVIEIRFQEETANGSLRHPIFVREREDKTPLN